MFDLIDLVGKSQFSKNDLERIKNRSNYEISDAIQAILYASSDIPLNKFDMAMEFAKDYGWSIANRDSRFIGGKNETKL